MSRKLFRWVSGRPSSSSASEGRKGGATHSARGQIQNDQEAHGLAPDVSMRRICRPCSAGWTSRGAERSCSSSPRQAPPGARGNLVADDWAAARAHQEAQYFVMLA